MTAATYKKTALKVLVLWNLPALLLLAGAFQFGISVIVQVKKMEMNPFKSVIQNLFKTKLNQSHYMICELGFSKKINGIQRF